MTETLISDKMKTPVLLSQSAYYVFGDLLGIAPERVEQLYQWASENKLNDMQLVFTLDQEKKVPCSAFLSEYELSLIAPEFSLDSSQKGFENHKAFLSIYHQERFSGKSVIEAYENAQEKQQNLAIRHQKRLKKNIGITTALVLALSGIGAWGSNRHLPQSEALPEIKQNASPKMIVPAKAPAKKNQNQHTR